MFTGDVDPHTTAEEGRAWADATTGPFAFKVCPGGHFYLNDRPQLFETLKPLLSTVGAARC